MTETSLRGKIHVEHGFPFKGEHFSSDGKYVVLTPGNFEESGGFKFDQEKAKFYAGEVPSNYICCKGDLIVAMTEQVEGLLGSAAIVPEDGRFLHNQRIGLVTVNDAEIHKLFLYYLFQTKTVRQQLRRSSSGSKVKHTSPDRIYDVIVNLPPVPTQGNIAAVLSAFDFKIELNKRINAELEAMAKTLYDYWFVQFDFPDQHGKPYKSSGGKMEWSDELKREIPDGWKVESIEENCHIIDCLHSKKPDTDFEGDGFYLLQLENILDNGLLDLTNRYFVSKRVYQNWTSRIEVMENDIVITNAGRVAATSQIPHGIKAGIGRNITAIRPLSISPTYLFLSFRGLDMKRQIKWNTDSGAFFTSLNVKGIKKLFIVRPPDKLEGEFEGLVHSVRRKREMNNFENQQLAELRDWLLPMLMNGQVTFMNERPH
jgi:type I restriction enzyme S subunit